jgi:hypothetical protein
MKSLKASLSGGFIAQFPTQSYFGNSTEEFHPHKTLPTPMKLSSSLYSSVQCHVSIFNVHKIYETPIEIDLRATVTPHVLMID